MNATQLRLRPALNGAALLTLATLPVACDGGDGGGGSRAGAGSNRARFTYECDVSGLIGTLTLDIEAIGSTGIVFGSGPNPDITGVIGTGGVTYFTSGQLVTPTTRYSFTGQNQFADFTNTTTPERFRVEWVNAPQGLTIVVNPFGPGPTQVPCRLTSAIYL
ncbi:MAG: hypothetical protein AAF628_28955 [Planctomycetota bacterium]